MEIMPNLIWKEKKEENIRFYGSKNFGSIRIDFKENVKSNKCFCTCLTNFIKMFYASVFK